MKPVQEGVSGALIVNGKILLVRRSKDDSYLPGYYELPGGKNDGEDNHTALIREFLEEVNLKIKPTIFFKRFLFYPGPTMLCADNEYLVELAGGESIDNLKLSFEHDDSRWLSKDDAIKLDKISDEKRRSIAAAFEAYEASVAKL